MTFPLKKYKYIISIYLQKEKFIYYTTNICNIQVTFVNVQNTVSAADCDFKQGNVMKWREKVWRCVCGAYHFALHPGLRTCK